MGIDEALGRERRAILLTRIEAMTFRSRCGSDAFGQRVPAFPKDAVPHSTGPLYPRARQARGHKLGVDWRNTTATGLRVPVDLLWRSVLSYIKLDAAKSELNVGRSNN